jgi:hypothetical protein
MDAGSEEFLGALTAGLFVYVALKALRLRWAARYLIASVGPGVAIGTGFGGSLGGEDAILALRHGLLAGTAYGVLAITDTQFGT